jgi:regulator of sigma E protease
MLETMLAMNTGLLAESTLDSIFWSVKYGGLMLLGFSLVIFVHELGHFAVAKWAGVKVEQFAIGFGKEIWGFTRGETRYSFNVLPLGGYVKMLGQEDFAVDKSGEWEVKADPRSFLSKPVGPRMAIVSAGVIMNILLAALLFMIVFMVGKETLDSVVGRVQEGAPADLAGLRAGDRILTIDGQEIDDFSDLSMAIMLAESGEPLEFTIERNEKIQTLAVTPKMNAQRNVQQVGISSPTTNRVLATFGQSGIDDQHQIQPDDVIKQIGPYTRVGYDTLKWAIFDNRDKPVKIVVERPKPDQDGKVEQITCYRRGELLFLNNPDGLNLQVGDFLGFVPRRKVGAVEPDSRAELAGFKIGDVILAWEGIAHPTFEECTDSILKNVERDIRVRVRRDSQELDLIVRPKEKKRHIFSAGKPHVGISFLAQENERVMVANTVAESNGTPTAASQLKLPRGTEILRIDEDEVHGWPEMVDLCRAKAGQTVSITYRYGDQPAQTASMSIPAAMSTSLVDADGNPHEMPLSARVISVAGQTHVTIRNDDGKELKQPITHWQHVARALRQHVGDQIEIVYHDHRTDRDVTATMTVTADNTEPWMRKLHYDPGPVIFAPDYKILRKSNPLAAMQLGVKKTYYFVIQAYTTMRAMISGSVGIENVAGPVGILKIGAHAAEGGIITLMWFLGLLSANLAVINFLPIPIVDGGLMVFLIIEKIKGSPVSLKIQVATQVIGLALIVSVFVLVTVMDISKW